MLIVIAVLLCAAMANLVLFPISGILTTFLLVFMASFLVVVHILVEHDLREKDREEWEAQVLRDHENAGKEARFLDYIEDCYLQAADRADASLAWLLEEEDPEPEWDGGGETWESVYTQYGLRTRSTHR